MVRRVLGFTIDASALYAAYVAQVALSQTAIVWMPNLVLLVGFVCARRAGVGWAAMAGLLCDGMTGRPLGVTMLVATLTATIARQHGPLRQEIGLLRDAATVFLAVGLIEASARALAGTVAASPDHWNEMVMALQIAISTALCSWSIRFAAVFVQAGWSRTVKGTRPQPLSPMWVQQGF